MKPVLELHSVSKKFTIHHQESYLSLRDRMSNVLRSSPREEDFWALKDVTFDVNPGDSLGIIGKNGAGKSTLLKILSKITPPTEGKIKGRGRMASLLEVGTGFHPELTGRENVFFNGSLMGMKKKEIVSRFDEIIDFSGTEKFLDTPLKHYSSGMQLRLAFSVAAFLEPEILIIDEVLAVGDAEFQKKCLGKMDDVRKSGRTILFVSHNMAAVSRLCNRSLLLDQGEITAMGTPDQVMHTYLKNREEKKTDRSVIKLAEGISLHDFVFQKSELSSGDSLHYSFRISSSAPNTISGLALLLYNELNERIGIVDLRSEELLSKSREKNDLIFSGTLNGLQLVDGIYHMGIYISSNAVQGDFYDLNSFHISLPEGDIVPYDKQHRGYISFLHEGRIQS
ncbi:MAG: ABC transporter ATP-binding protein [Cyclobacteriaceae bacterium]|nr:ABC transporter ATP-binding protein [Cyclobacteriaceae bacterium]